MYKARCIYIEKGRYYSCTVYIVVDCELTLAVKMEKRMKKIEDKNKDESI